MEAPQDPSPVAATPTVAQTKHHEQTEAPVVMQGKMPVGSPAAPPAVAQGIRGTVEVEAPLVGELGAPVVRTPSQDHPATEATAPAVVWAVQEKPAPTVTRPDFPVRVERDEPAEPKQRSPEPAVTRPDFPVRVERVPAVPKQKVPEQPITRPDFPVRRERIAPTEPKQMAPEAPPSPVISDDLPLIQKQPRFRPGTARFGRPIAMDAANLIPVPAQPIPDTDAQRLPSHPGVPAGPIIINGTTPMP